jgi:hypothetical protein
MIAVKKPNRDTTRTHMIAVKKPNREAVPADFIPPPTSATRYSPPHLDKDALLKAAWRAVGLYDDDDDEEDEPPAVTAGGLPVSSSSSADMPPSQEPAKINNKWRMHCDAAEKSYRQAALTGLFSKDSGNKQLRTQQHTMSADEFKQGDFNAQTVAAPAHSNYDMAKEKCEQWMATWMGDGARIVPKKAPVLTADWPSGKKKTAGPRRSPIDQAAPGVLRKNHPAYATHKPQRMPKWTMVTDDDGFMQKLRFHTRSTSNHLGRTAPALTANKNMGMLTVLKTDMLVDDEDAEQSAIVLAMTQHELDQAHDTFMLTVTKTDMLAEVQEPLADPSNTSCPASIRTEVLAFAEAGKIAVHESSPSKSTKMVDHHEVNPMQPPRKKTPAQTKLDKQMKEKAATDKEKRKAIMQANRQARVLARRRARQGKTPRTSHTPWWKKLSSAQEEEIIDAHLLGSGGDTGDSSCTFHNIIALWAHRRAQAHRQEQYRIMQGIWRKERQNKGHHVSRPQNAQKATGKAASMFVMGIIDRSAEGVRIRMKVKSQVMQDWESRCKLSRRWAAIMRKRRRARVRALKRASDGLRKSKEEPVTGYHHSAPQTRLPTMTWARFARKFACLVALKKMQYDLIEMGFSVREVGDSYDLVNEGRPVRSASDDGNGRVVDSGTSGRDGNDFDGISTIVSAITSRSASSDGGNSCLTGTDPGQGADTNGGDNSAADFEYPNDAQHAPLKALKHTLPITALSLFATGLMSALSDTVSTLPHTHSSTNHAVDVGTLPSQTAVSEAADLHSVDASSINIGNSSPAVTQNGNFFTSFLPALWGRTGGSGRGAKPSMASRGRGAPHHRGNSSPASQRERPVEDDALSVAASGSLTPSIRPHWEIDDGTMQSTLAAMKLGAALPGGRYEEPDGNDGKSVTSYAESTRTAIHRESGPEAFRALVEDEFAINETLLNNIIPSLYQGQYRSTMEQCKQFWLAANTVKRYYREMYTPPGSGPLPPPSWYGAMTDDEQARVTISGIPEALARMWPPQNMKSLVQVLQALYKHFGIQPAVFEQPRTRRQPMPENLNEGNLRDILDLSVEVLTTLPPDMAQALEQGPLPDSCAQRRGRDGAFKMTVGTGLVARLFFTPTLDEDLMREKAFVVRVQSNDGRRIWANNQAISHMLRLMQAAGINRLDAADIIRHQLHHQGVPVDRVIFRPHTPVRCLAMTAQGQRVSSVDNKSLRTHWFLADEILVLMQGHRHPPNLEAMPLMIWLGHEPGKQETTTLGSGAQSTAPSFAHPHVPDSGYPSLVLGVFLMRKQQGQGARAGGPQAPPISHPAICIDFGRPVQIGSLIPDGETRSAKLTMSDISGTWRRGVTDSIQDTGISQALVPVSLAASTTGSGVPNGTKIYLVMTDMNVAVALAALLRAGMGEGDQNGHVAHLWPRKARGTGPANMHEASLEVGQLLQHPTSMRVVGFEASPDSPLTRQVKLLTGLAHPHNFDQVNKQEQYLLAISISLKFREHPYGTGERSCNICGDTTLPGALTDPEKELTAFCKSCWGLVIGVATSINARELEEEPHIQAVACSASGCQVAQDQLCVKQDGAWTCGLCWEQHAGLVASVSGGFVEHLGTDCSAQSAAEDPLTAIIAHKALQALISFRASIHGPTTGLARKLLKPNDPTEFSVVCAQCATSQRGPDGRCVKCTTVGPGQHASQWSAKTTMSGAAETSMKMEDVGSPAASSAPGHTATTSTLTTTKPSSQVDTATSSNEGGRIPGVETQLRVDPADGQPYRLDSFLEFYGTREGKLRWDSAVPQQRESVKQVAPEASAGAPAPLEVAAALGSSTAESTQGDGETDRTSKHEIGDVSANPSGDVPNTDDIESANADGSHSKLTSVVASAAGGPVAARRTATAGSEAERKRVRPPPTSPASSTSSAVKEAKKPAFAQPPTPAGKSAGQPLNLTSPRPEARGGGQLSPSGKRGQH